MCVVLLIAATGCNTEQCVDRLTSSESCGPRVCVALDPPIVLSSAADADAALACSGCEQTTPEGYMLSATIGARPPTQPMPPPYWEIELHLAPTWDRSFSPASLNAAIRNNSTAFLAIGVDAATEGGPIRQTVYTVRRGSVLSARLARERVRLEIEAYLGLVEGLPSDPAKCEDPSACSCLFSNPPANQTVSRIFTVDLPYRAAAPETP